MQTKFQLTLDDWKAFNKAVGARGVSWWLVIIIFLLMTPLQIMTNPQMRLRYQMGGIGALARFFLKTAPFLLIPIALMALMWFGVSYFQTQSLKKQPMFAAPLVIRADDEGIEGTSSTGRDTIFWSAVHKIIETPTHIFVLNSPQGGLIIPQRAFASATEAAQFIGYVRQQYAKAQPEKPPIAQP